MNDPQSFRTAMAQLALDGRFQLFMEGIRELKESAIADAITADQAGDARKSSANLGEIRAYRDIEGIYQEALRTRLDDTAEKD